MAGKKKPGLAAHVKPVDVDRAAAVADALETRPSATRGQTHDLSPHSYNLPMDQIDLLAEVAAARVSDARKRRVKGTGRVSASSVLREVIEAATEKLEKELRRLRE